MFDWLFKRKKDKSAFLPHLSDALPKEQVLDSAWIVRVLKDKE